MKQKGGKRIFCLFAALVLILSACSGGTGDNGAKAPERIINMAFTTAWGDFVPYYSLAQTMYEQALYDKIYDKLAFIDMAGAEVLPRAAKSWESDMDGKTVVFHLDENAHWSDGEPVTARDWVFTVNLLADPASGFNTRVCTPDIVGTDRDGVKTEAETLGAEAVDDYTLRFTFKERTTPEDFLFNYNREFVVLPEHLLSGTDPASILEAAYWTNPVGSGPCVYVSQIAGSEMVLTPNPYYHLWSGNWDKLILRVIDSSTRLSGLISGEIDMVALGADITADDIPLAEAGGLIVRDAEVRNFFMEVRINERSISSPLIRQALSCALDRDALISASTARDVGIPAYSCQMVNSAYYDPDLAFPRDVEKAKALLEEAGYDGKTYTIAFASKRQSMVELMAQQWAEAGIHVQMVVVDVSTMFAGLANGTYDMGISGHNATAYSLWFEGEFPADEHPVLDPGRMDFLYRIHNTVDREEQTEIVREYQRYLADKTFFIPLYFSGSYWVESKRVTGIRNAASLLCNDNVWEWRLAE